jgi:hypothetical protein
MPMPAIRSATVSSIQLVASEPLIATQANPPVSRKSPVAMTFRGPMRSATAPAIGEMNIGVAKNGSRCTPVASGE